VISETVCVFAGAPGNAPAWITPMIGLV